MVKQRATNILNVIILLILICCMPIFLVLSVLIPFRIILFIVISVMGFLFIFLIDNFKYTYFLQDDVFTFKRMGYPNTTVDLTKVKEVHFLSLSYIERKRQQDLSKKTVPEIIIYKEFNRHRVLSETFIVFNYKDGISERLPLTNISDNMLLALISALKSNNIPFYEIS